MDEWKKIGEKASQRSENKKIKSKDISKLVSKTIKEEKQNYTKSMKVIATRKSSQKILKSVTRRIP